MRYWRILGSICVKGYQDNHQIWWLARRTHRTQKLLYEWLWFITVKGFRGKSAKWKGTWGKVQRNQRSKSDVYLYIGHYSMQLLCFVYYIHCILQAGTFSAFGHQSLYLHHGKSARSYTHGLMAQKRVIPGNSLPNDNLSSRYNLKNKNSKISVYC